MISKSLEKDELIVVGAGLFRTGTNSLKLALEILLKGKCYHMKEVLANPSHIPLWIKALENNGLSKEEWTKIMKNYKATLDCPAVVFYEELMNLYPNSKVILTERDPHEWVKSVRKTIYPTCLAIHKFPLNVFLTFTPYRLFGKFLHLNHQRIVSLEEIVTDEEKCIDQFNQWTSYVKSVVPPEKLLIFESKQGWRPLCEFLNLPIPQEDYPYVNTSDEKLKELDDAKKLAYTFVFGLPALICFVIFSCFF